MNADRSATPICDDGNDTVVFTKQFEYTDFPLDSITPWLTNNTILLPGEHLRSEDPPALPVGPCWLTTQRHFLSCRVLENCPDFITETA